MIWSALNLDMIWSPCTSAGAVKRHRCAWQLTHSSDVRARHSMLLSLTLLSAYLGSVSVTPSSSLTVGVFKCPPERRRSWVTHHREKLRLSLRRSWRLTRFAQPLPGATCGDSGAQWCCLSAGKSPGGLWSGTGSWWGGPAPTWPRSPGRRASGSATPATWAGCRWRCSARWRWPPSWRWRCSPISLQEEVTLYHNDLLLVVNRSLIDVN